ncbi:MAG TPA: bacteriophage abortive infection AbiH family protein [Savagea sp.]
MSRLFVIGNGFDLSHNLKTSYEDFRKYLISDRTITTDSLIVPESQMLPDGGIEYDQEEVLSMLFYLISDAEYNTEKWSNVEASLANLNFSLIFDQYNEVLDKEGDIDFWKTSYNNQDIASDLVIPTLTIQQLFSDWINTINISDAKAKNDFIELTENEALFLNFNYTETLEVIYEVPNEHICYIHGKQNEEIYFGHGSKDDITDYYMDLHVGSEDGIFEIHQGLRKKTELALENKKYFFDILSVSNIKEIYSYGFSFSEVDMLYMKEICEQVDTQNTVWYFNDFDCCNHTGYKEKLLMHGFKGEFGTFNISK